ncbi:MAG TPA: hypothetical protein VK213_05895 [Bacteroidales bacterium]|nr:hypothetical protein [Bacteroidales bacterium]
MNFIKLYLREIQHLKSYMLILVLVMLASFSVYFFLDEPTIARIGDEDHLFEYLTSLSFLICSAIFLYICFKNRNFIFFLLAIAFFIGFGEEISWGQRILGFSTPESLMEINAQEEFNFHNIMTWEINFVFKVFTLMFGIVLPFLVYHFRFFKSLSMKLRIPVPPISLGIFFMADWLVFRFFLDFVLHPGGVPKYYFSVTEIYEFITSFIMLVISLYFLHYRHLGFGADIKDNLDYLESEKVEMNEFKPVLIYSVSRLMKVAHKQLTFVFHKTA